HIAQTLGDGPGSPRNQCRVELWEVLDEGVELRALEHECLGGLQGATGGAVPVVIQEKSLAEGLSRAEGAKAHRTTIPVLLYRDRSRSYDRKELARISFPEEDGVGVETLRSHGARQPPVVGVGKVGQEGGCAKCVADDGHDEFGNELQEPSSVAEQDLRTSIYRMRIALLTCMLLLAACGEAERIAEQFRATPATPHERYARVLEDAGLMETAMGRDWLAAADAALESPVPVSLPYRERAYFTQSEASAGSWSFTARRGERIRITLAREDTSTFAVFA